MGDFFRHEESRTFLLTKDQISFFLTELDGVKINNERKYIAMQDSDCESSQELTVCVDMETMGITADALTEAAMQEELVMAFNAEYIEDAFRFVLCSDDENAEICYNGSAAPLVLRSGRF